jgi:hypothetical protein
MPEVAVWDILDQLDHLDLLVQQAPQLDIRVALAMPVVGVMPVVEDIADQLEPKVHLVQQGQAAQPDQQVPFRAQQGQVAQQDQQDQQAQQAQSPAQLAPLE